MVFICIYEWVLLVEIESCFVCIHYIKQYGLCGNKILI